MKEEEDAAREGNKNRKNKSKQRWNPHVFKGSVKEKGVLQFCGNCGNALEPVQRASLSLYERQFSRPVLVECWLCWLIRLQQTSFSNQSDGLFG